MLLGNDPVGAFVDYPSLPVASAATGPLAGLTLAVKDLYDVSGYPDRRRPSAAARLERRQAGQQPAVQTLLDAGVRFVGKTHTDEFAYSMNGENPRFRHAAQPARAGPHPWWIFLGFGRRGCRRLADVALGTDTGGSIRLPAAYCGLVGLRPTHGRIDTNGLQPLARSFDTVGWFARDIGVYQTVAKLLLPAAGDQPPITRLFVATDIAEYVLGDVERRVFEAALERLSRIVDINGDVTVAPDGFDAWRPVFRTIQAYEAWTDHGAWITEHRPELGAGVRERFAWAAGVSRPDYDTATAAKAIAGQHIASLIPPGSALVFPTAPSVALPLGMSGDELESYRNRSISMLCSAGLSGLPQVSMPMAEIDGLPFGISLLGPEDSDLSLLALCRGVIEQSAG